MDSYYTKLNEHLEADVAGMAAAAVYGGARMGAIFSGMLLSGKKLQRS